MNYGVQEGRIPTDFIEYDFAEDALDFEVSSFADIASIRLYL